MSVIKKPVDQFYKVQRNSCHTCLTKYASKLKSNLYYVSVCRGHETCHFEETFRYKRTLEALSSQPFFGKIKIKNWFLDIYLYSYTCSIRS